MAVFGTLAGLAMAGGAVGMALLAVRYEMQEIRRQAGLWKQWAEDRGWSHQERAKAFEGHTMDPFDRGRNRQTTQVIDGVWSGVPFQSFHFTFVTGGGKASTTHKRTVVRFATGADFPNLTVRTQWRATLTPDITFESKAFNEQFDVRGDDPRFTHDIVHPLMIQALLKGALKDSNFSIDNGYLVVSCRDHLLRSQMYRLYRQLAEMVALVPGHVWREYQVDPPTVTKSGASALPPAAA